MFQFNQISQNIQKSLFDRIDALNRDRNFSPLSPQSDRQSSMDAMLTKSVWASVTSARYDEDQDGRLLDGSRSREHGKMKKKLMRISSGIDDNIQPINAPITTKNNFNKPNKDDMHRGHSGITSITTSFKTHSIQDVTINWKFYDIKDFEKYKEAFLKHGRVVLVEFGWASNNQITIEKQEVKDPDDLLEIFNSTEEQIKGAGGDYYCAMGRIKNYSYTINQNGGFDCTTILTSMGSSLFKGPIDPVFSKKVPEIIVQGNADKAELLKNASHNFEAYMKNLDENLRKEYNDGKGTQGVYHDGKKGWCNWGWFEDIVLNTFFGWIDEISTEMITSVKSRDIEFYIDGKSKVTDKFEKNTLCRCSENLYTNGTNIILPGQTVGIVDNDGKKFSGVLGESMMDKFPPETVTEYLQLFKTLSEIDDPKIMPPFAAPIGKGPDGEEIVQSTTGKWFYWPKADREAGTKSAVVVSKPTLSKEKGVIRNMVFSSDFLNQSFGEGVTNLGSALDSHWSAVSSHYAGYWDFQVVSSKSGNGQIGLIDRYTTVQRVQEVNPDGAFGKKSTRDDLNGTFVFSNYGKNSLVKDFSMDVKLTAAQATMAVYHSNKNPKVTGGGTNKPEDWGVAALAELQNINIITAVSGSVQSGKEDLVIRTATYLALQSKINAYVDSKDQSSGLKPGGVEVNAEDKQLYGDQSLDDLTAEFAKLSLDEQSALAGEVYMSFKDDNPDNAGLIYTPDGEMIPGYNSYMLHGLTKTPQSRIDSDPLVPFTVSFSIPGIGGISLFDVFSIDYLPETYKEFVVFQATAVDHTLDSTGWTTSITGQMRIDTIKLEEKKEEQIADNVKSVVGDTKTSFDFIKLYIEANKKKVVKTT